MKDIAWMDRYWKEVLQVSTRKHGINVQYLYDSSILNILSRYNVKTPGQSSKPLLRYLTHLWPNNKLLSTLTYIWQLKIADRFNKNCFQFIRDNCVKQFEWLYVCCEFQPANRSKSTFLVFSHFLHQNMKKETKANLYFDLERT